MKPILILSICLIFLTASTRAQQDTLAIYQLAKYAQRLDPNKADSVLVYAEQIYAASKKYDYQFGLVSSIRLRGFYFQYTENYDSAIVYFHEYARQCEHYKLQKQRIVGLADVAAIYMETQQYQLAKQIYLQCLPMLDKGSTARQVSMLHNNLAGAYQYLGMYDSALFYYKIAIQIDSREGDSILLAERKSNISEVLIPLGKYALAKKYLEESMKFNIRNDRTDALWYNYCNLGLLYLKLEDYQKSEYYYELSRALANTMQSKSKLSQSLSGLSKLYQDQGDFKSALQFKIQSDSLASLLVNESTNSKIAALQIRYQTEKAEKAKSILEANLGKQLYQKKIYSTIATALFVISFIVVISLYNIYKKKKILQHTSKLVSEQRDKLTALNLEKNNLISMVSHDLISPISNIKIWTGLLEKEIDENDMEKKDIVAKIKSLSDYGYNLISNILNVEKIKTGVTGIEYETVALKPFLEATIQEFSSFALSKNISITLQVSPSNIDILTDRLLLKRVIENLVSNAIKYSGNNTEVTINARKSVNNYTAISIADQGPGFSSEEKRMLFGKYVYMNNKNNLSEQTTGLGLFIVKRIVTELNGQIEVTSEEGKGACFTILLK